MPLWGRRTLFFASRAAALALLLLAALAVHSHTRYLESLAALPEPPLRIAGDTETEIAATLATGGQERGPAASREPVALTIKRGETLSATLRGLGLAPGAAFGPEGEGYVRWCFAAGEERLADGVRRLAASLR